MAKDIKFLIQGEPGPAVAALKEMQANGEDVSKYLGAAFRQMGVDSESAINKQKQAVVTAFEVMKASGVASAAEIQRAQDAMQNKLRQLDAVINPAKAQFRALNNELAAMAATGNNVTDRLARDFETLGIRSTAAIEKERAAYVAAFEKIKASGVASAAEIQRAQAAISTQLTRLDKEQSLTAAAAGAKQLTENLGKVGDGVNRLNNRFQLLNAALVGWFVGGKIIDGFRAAFGAVDEFQQSVAKTAAMITSLQGGNDIAASYQRAKEYAGGLNQELQKIDARTTLNLSGLQSITEEMIKQGVVLDYNNTSQVEAFTRLANAAAVYSRNGADERQLRQEVAALLRGEVNENAQLASMIQRTVDGPLRQKVEQWRQSGTLVKEIGDRLKGFGPASDDLATSWSAVKSSLSTSVELVMRAGFTSVVKDVAEWLNKANEYLKSHADLIGAKIKSAWDTFKEGLKTAAEIFVTLKDNAEPFVAIFVGGALIKGVSGLIGWFLELRKTVLSVREALIAMNLVAAASNIAGAAGGAGTTIGGTVAAGGLMATLGLGAAAVGAGVGLGYAAQPLVRWADKKLYQNFGWNLTGEAMYNEAMQREAESTQRYNEMLARKQQGKAGANIPVIQLQDTPEQVKAKTDFMSKELSAFKELQDRKTALAKSQADITLEITKNSYDQGLVSTRNYYEKEKQIALDAAQQKFANAAEYLAKEKELLAYVESKKGVNSPEYQEELSRNQKALEAMQLAQMEYGKTYLDLESKLNAELRKREEEYQKLTASALESAGQYVAAEKLKQDMDLKSSEYLRLKKEAEEGVQSAVEALAATEKKRAIDMQAARNKENEEARAYAEEVAKMRDEYDQLMGKDKEMIDAEAKLRDGRNKLAELNDKVALAWKQGNAVAIAGLSEQIRLQERLNGSLQTQKDFLEQVKVLTGEIVGFSGDTPIYAKMGGAFSNGDAVSLYQSAAAAAAAAQGRSAGGVSSGFDSGIRFVDINGMVLGSNAVGTRYVSKTGLYQLHRGESVNTRQETSAKADPGVIRIEGGINITVQGGDTSAQTLDEIARKLVPKLDEYRRYRAA